MARLRTFLVLSLIAPFVWSVAAAALPPLPIDFDGDGDADCDDVNLLTIAIVSGTNEALFDLNGDNLVDGLDLNVWLVDAGVANLGAPYQGGDANLDGTVDALDYTVWRSHEGTSSPAWCNGDFNADGFVDGADEAILCANAAPGVCGPTFTPVAVCDLKVDANGDCVADTPPVGDTVSVEGIVLAWKQYGTRGAGAILDPVSKCCISVFDITDAPDFPAGQRVRVEGWVGNFAGLLEITDDPADGSQDPIVTDLGFFGEITPFEVASGMLADFSPFAELEESCLLSVCGTFDTTDAVFAANANYTFLGTDGKSCIVRIDADTDVVGQPIPTDTTLVSGVLGQFNSFTDTCIGYQLLPRSTADIEEGKCKPVPAESKTWGSIKSDFGNE